jgi:hypothetical protein
MPGPENRIGWSLTGADFQRTAAAALVDDRDACISDIDRMAVTLGAASSMTRAASWSWSQGSA